MKVITNIFTCVLLIILNTSCEDIFEPSLENKQVSVIAPGDSAESQTYAVTFWWNPLDHALRYNLQIVTPGFASNTVLVLDTTISGTKFSYSFDPGDYQWRIKALNGSSATPYITRTLSVANPGLTGQPVLPTAPADNVYLNSQVVTFSWQALFGTTEYIIEADTITGNFVGSLVLNEAVPFKQYTHNFGTDGRFVWRVKATNATEESDYSDIREFIIDTQKPTTVGSLVSPNQAKPVPLSWAASSDAFGVSKYKLYAYKSDSTIFSNAYPKDITGISTSFNESAALSGSKILWRVTAVDIAGNESAFSPYGSFTIQSF